MGARKGEVGVSVPQTRIEGHQVTGRLADDFRALADRVLEERVAQELLCGSVLDMPRQALAPLNNVQQQFLGRWPSVAVRHQSGRAPR